MRDPEIQQLQGVKCLEDRKFATNVMQILTTSYSLLEYAKRIRAKYPHLSDLAIECERMAKEAEHIEGLGVASEQMRNSM